MNAGNDAGWGGVIQMTVWAPLLVAAFEETVEETAHAGTA
jgi:hypothetical protein